MGVLSGHPPCCSGGLLSGQSDVRRDLTENRIFFQTITSHIHLRGKSNCLQDLQISCILRDGLRGCCDSASKEATEYQSEPSAQPAARSVAPAGISIGQGCEDGRSESDRPGFVRKLRACLPCP